MAVPYDKIEIFKNNLTTLKETSVDKDGDCCEYMTESLLEVVNFDNVKNDYIRNMKLSVVPCSNDALYKGEAENYTFIEFKNGKMSKQKIFNVFYKIYDSLLIFNDIIKENISYCREHVNFILVYNEQKNVVVKEDDRGIQESPSKIAIGKYFIEQKANKKFIRFNLERFEKRYFNEVYTYTEKEFEEKFSR